MPKGRTQYKSGEAVVVRQLSCGRVFSGDKKQVEKLAALHKKGCALCKQSKFTEVRATENAAAGSTKEQIVVQSLAGLI